MSNPKIEKVQSVRLTKDMADEITQGLVDHKLAKREAAHKAAEFKLALRVYQNQFSPAERRKIEELPDGWLPTSEHVYVNVGSDWQYLHFSEKRENHRRDTKRFPVARKGAFQYEARSEIGLAIREYLNEAAAIKSDRKELQAKAAGVLSSVTTTARLAEVWPEVVAFIPKYVPRQLPAVRRDELNAAFGLNAA